MPPLSHLSYPSLLFIFVSHLLGIEYSFFQLSALAFGSVFPDLDLFFFSFLKKKKRRFAPLDFFVLLATSIFPGSDSLLKGIIREERFEERFGHRSWLTHTPLFYFPPVLLYLLRPRPWLGLFCFGFFCHLVLDTMDDSGILWAWPLERRKASLLPSSGERGDSCLETFREYKRRFRYKIDLAASLLLFSFFALSLAGISLSSLVP